jgi:hypothetical protein
MNDAEKGGRHILLTGLELQGLTNYQAKDLMSSTLASLWEDKQAQLPDVEKIIYAAMDEAWKEYEAGATPP